MSYPAFAYTLGMQWILFLVSILSNFLFFWYITNILLTIFGEKASIQQKVMFVLLAGIVMNTLWIYGVFAAGGFLQFNELTYRLVVSPNPIFALLYCLVAVKVLKLPTYRSICMMRHVYLYMVINRVMIQIIGRAFFAQNESSYNYLLDAIGLCACTVVTTAIYFVTMEILHRTQFLIRITDRLHTNSIRSELTVSFIQASAFYVIILIIPAITISKVMGYLVTFGFLLFALAVSILIDYKSAIEVELQNKDVYIGTLTNSIEDC